MEVDATNPKTIMAAVVVLAGAIGGGSMLGLTVEPEETTQMRIDKAKLEERSLHLEGQVEDLEDRVSELEDLADECRAAIMSCTALLEER